MKVLYKCRCMEAEREIDVTDRVPDSDIGEWMERVVVPSVSYDHSNRNEHCRSSVLEYLKVPMEEGQPIGTPATRN